MVTIRKFNKISRIIFSADGTKTSYSIYIY